MLELHKYYINNELRNTRLFTAEFCNLRVVCNNQQSKKYSVKLTEKICFLRKQKNTVF